MNWSKSQIFFSPNIPFEIVYDICNIVGFKHMDNLRMYLGIPLVHERVGRKMFDFVVDKV